MKFMKYYAQRQITKIKGIFHCFSGTKIRRIKLLIWGFSGKGGISTLKNSNMDSVLKEIDIKNIVLETDSILFSSTPFREKEMNPNTWYLSPKKFVNLKI